MRARSSISKYWVPLLNCFKTCSIDIANAKQQGFIQDFLKRGGKPPPPPPPPKITVPITNVLTARIHLWRNYRCLSTDAYPFCCLNVGGGGGGGGDFRKVGGGGGGVSGPSLPSPCMNPCYTGKHIAPILVSGFLMSKKTEDRSLLSCRKSITGNYS